MQEENNNSKTLESSKKSVSIGALLANARTAASLNQTDVAEQINLSKKIIQALETDDYASLPETTYIRGYLRNYARVVDINGDGLVKLYTDQHYREPVIEANKKSTQSYDPAILWSTAAVLTILIGLVISWWFDANQLSFPAEQLAKTESVAGELLSGPKVSNEEQVGSSNSNDDVVSITEDTSITSTTTQSSSDGPENIIKVEVISADQQQAMEEASHNPTLVTSLDGVQVLTVTYTEESWTEIRDADANTLMQGLVEPGVVRNLSGKPPFEIFLGNSPGVIIEVNGLYFDHSQYSRNNRTARFQVSSGSLN